MDKSELDDLKICIYGKLRSAIEGGCKDEALALLDEIDKNRADYRNVYLSWIDLLLTYIADRMGEEAVYDTMRIFDGKMVRQTIAGAAGDIDADDRLRKRAYIWTSLHGGTIDEIEEDHEKFILKFRCPSGGAVRTKEDYGRTKKAYLWTYGMEGFPYYCVHCPVSFDIMSIEDMGYPAWVTLHQPEGRCVQYLYKDPAAVPEEYYKRVGKEKPGAE